MPEWLTGVLATIMEATQDMGFARRGSNPRLVGSAAIYQSLVMIYVSYIILHYYFKFTPAPSKLVPYI